MYVHEEHAMLVNVAFMLRSYFRYHGAHYLYPEAVYQNPFGCAWSCIQLFILWSLYSHTHATKIQR